MAIKHLTYWSVVDDFGDLIDLLVPELDQAADAVAYFYSGEHTYCGQTTTQPRWGY